jgi:hypothetical protein
MQNRFFVYMLVLVSALSGCTAYDVTSGRTSSPVDPTKKILVAIIAEHDRMDNFPKFFGALEQELQSDLSACGVQSDSIRVPIPGVLELSLGNPAKDAMAKLQNRIDAFRPDNTLEVHFSIPNGARTETFAQLVQADHKLVWHATIKNDYWDMTMGFVTHGHAMADSIVQQLSSDGMLKACSPFP